jgi:PAS domain-containing protein
VTDEARFATNTDMATDIDNRIRAEQDLRRSDAYLTEAQRLSRTGSFGCNVSTGEMFWSEETFRIFSYDRAITPSVEAILQRVHPEDRAMVQEQIARATSEGKDIPLLVEYFVKRYAAKARKPITKIDKRTLEVCRSYHWPGNIRELQNIVERSVILCNGDTFSVEQGWLSGQPVGRPESGLSAVERRPIEQALHETGWNKSKAARRLGITRTQLYCRLRRYGLETARIATGTQA